MLKCPFSCQVSKKLSRYMVFWQDLWNFVKIRGILAAGWPLILTKMPLILMRFWKHPCQDEGHWGVCHKQGFETAFTPFLSDFPPDWIFVEHSPLGAYSALTDLALVRCAVMTAHAVSMLFRVFQSRPPSSALSFGSWTLLCSRFPTLNSAKRRKISRLMFWLRTRNFRGPIRFLR